MNFYKHHIGDYAQATTHLSMFEDIVYTRLLRRYYADEKPLSGDVAHISRWIGAKTDDERATVGVILAEFFVLESDGCYHNRRADAEIVEYQAEGKQRAARVEHEAERLRLYRERRSMMFAALKVAGVIPEWNVGMRELQKLYASVCTLDVHVQNKNATAIPEPEPEPEPNIKTRAPRKAAAASSDVGDLLRDVDPKVIADWKALRDRKRAPITATSVKQIASEAAKAGLSLEAALVMACGRGWTGFKADWVKDVQAPGRDAGRSAAAATMMFPPGDV